MSDHKREIPLFMANRGTQQIEVNSKELHNEKNKKT